MVKDMLRTLALTASVLALTIVGAPRARAESALDFTVVNATGYGIKALHVAPSESDNWEENLLEEVLENGESVAVSFSPKAEKIKEWDIMVEWVDEDANVEWHGYKLSEISKLTLKYDRESGKTTAISE